MSFERMGGGALEYYPCRYGQSRTTFRGPKVRLEGDFAVIFGGSEVYGRYVEHPFPELIADQHRIKTVNMGVCNAGIDVFQQDEALITIANEAKVCVIQVMGAGNMSNRFYRVHPRRNDRFLQPSALMQTLFQEVDFSDFHFTRHLLTSLRNISADKFRMVQQELQAAWTARMRLMLSRITSKKVLLWVPDSGSRALDGTLGPEPLMVTQAMVDDLRSGVDGIVKVETGATRMAANLEGMVVGETDMAAAREMLPPACHEEVAQALGPVLNDLM